jgi:hypothetical protein
MTQLAGLLAVATVFIGLWTLKPRLECALIAFTRRALSQLT